MLQILYWYYQFGMVGGCPAFGWVMCYVLCAIMCYVLCAMDWQTRFIRYHIRYYQNYRWILHLCQHCPVVSVLVVYVSIIVSSMYCYWCHSQEGKGNINNDSL